MSCALRIVIHATPGARRTEVAGAHGDALRVRLAAAPIDGKANAALLAWAAATFGVPKAAVALVSGPASRHKVLSVSFADEAARVVAMNQIQAWMARDQ